MFWSKTTKFLLFLSSLYILQVVVAFSSLQHDFYRFEQQLTLENQAMRTIEIEQHNNISDIHKATKPWTFIVYMAADNDLRAFAANNIKQMESIGSNEYINIIICLHIRLNGNQKITRWYYVEKNKIIPMGQEYHNHKMDSGDPQSLITCCKWAIESFPAQNYALIFWNHGTGIIDPKHYRLINPAELFTFNPTTNRFDLDRSINYLDLFEYFDMDQRGICWDNSSGNYLTNQKLEFALNEICSKHLHGKFKLIGFDACLMSMLEIGNLIKDYAEIMVGSQEVELGTGWNYAYILQPFIENNPTPIALANHIVKAYKMVYEPITNDFTQSAVDLNRIKELEHNVNHVASLLLQCLQIQVNNSVRKAIQESRNRRICTHFDVPSYIDLANFYSNLLANIGKFRISQSQQIISQLSAALHEGKKIISSIVFSNTSGKNLKKAHGLSIYFPEQYIDPSYTKCRFALENNWIQFIQRYRN